MIRQPKWLGEEQKYTTTRRWAGWCMISLVSQLPLFLIAVIIRPELANSITGFTPLILGIDFYLAAFPATFMGISNYFESKNRKDMLTAVNGAPDTSGYEEEENLEEHL